MAAGLLCLYTARVRDTVKGIKSDLISARRRRASVVSAERQHELIALGPSLLFRKPGGSGCF